jgi:UTP--glucose-1-phosphate uridylyltransferase
MPALELIINEAVDSGITEILLISAYGKEAIENYFTTTINDSKYDALNNLKRLKEKVKIYFKYQEEPLGNGQAMLLAKDFVGNEPFVVMFGDDLIRSSVPVVKQMIELHEKYNGNIIGVQRVDKKDVDKYGIVKFKNDTIELESIIEKPSIKEAPSAYAGLGRYIVSPEVFNELLNIKQKSGEFYFTDALKEIMKYQKTYACIFEGTYYDLGSKLGYLKANIDYSLEDEEIKKDVLDYLKSIEK